MINTNTNLYTVITIQDALTLKDILDDDNCATVAKLYLKSVRLKFYLISVNEI